MLPDSQLLRSVMNIRLTQFSHGAGCGCKIAPNVLEQIVQSQLSVPDDPKLLVGNASNDDAAAYDLGDGRAIVSTTDFFMPIVDDPFDFGRVAATNAMSDIFAMGAKPLMAIAILGWPLNKLDASVAQQVVDGGRRACLDAGFHLAGGHSIDAPEPIFGTAVTGLVETQHLQRNDTATADCELWLSKPLGIGVLTTAEKQQKLAAEHIGLARDVMCTNNQLGASVAHIPGVRAMTDVTGFGLLGHLLEMCRGAQLSAELFQSQIPKLAGVDEYIRQDCVPGGTHRNFASYGHQVSPLGSAEKAILCDPQTSGGLLIAVEPNGTDELLSIAEAQPQTLHRIGRFVSAKATIPDRWVAVEP